jgi:hypothetical protein
MPGLDVHTPGTAPSRCLVVVWVGVERREVTLQHLQSKVPEAVLHMVVEVGDEVHSKSFWRTVDQLWSVLLPHQHQHKPEHQHQLHHRSYRHRPVLVLFFWMAMQHSLAPSYGRHFCSSTRPCVHSLLVLPHPSDRLDIRPCCLHPHPQQLQLQHQHQHAHLHLHLHLYRQMDHRHRHHMVRALMQPISPASLGCHPEGKRSLSFELCHLFLPCLCEPSKVEIRRQATLPKMHAIGEECMLLEKNACY